MGPASVTNQHILDINNFIVKGKHNFRYGNIEILLKDDYKSCLQKIRKWVSMGQGIMFFIYSMRKPWTRKPSLHKQENHDFIYSNDEMDEEERRTLNKSTWENVKKDEMRKTLPYHYMLTIHGNPR